MTKCDKLYEIKQHLEFLVKSVNEVMMFDDNSVSERLALLTVYNKLYNVKQEMRQVFNDD